MVKVTWLVLLFAVLSLAGYDVVAMIYGGLEATISVQVYRFAVAEPLIPFALGILFGHLLWPNQGAVKKGTLPPVKEDNKVRIDE